MKGEHPGKHKPMARIFFVLSISTLAICCRDTPAYNDPIPQHDSLRITSAFVNEERVINVWTPLRYVQSNDSFPVLYMPDGGVKEDFPHIANTLAKLVEEGTIPPLILVGIENTVRGRDLTGASNVKEHEEYGIPMEDGAKDFRAFITEELVPEINLRYRTTPKKGIIGESLAGLFVMETFFLTPEAFDFYIAMDPSFWWNGNYLVNHAGQFLANLPERKTKLWFAGSGTTDIMQHTNQLAEYLKDHQPPNLVWKYSPEPEEEHSTIFRATKEKALIWVLNGED